MEAPFITVLHELLSIIDKKNGLRRTSRHSYTLLGDQFSRDKWRYFPDGNRAEGRYRYPQERYDQVRAILKSQRDYLGQLCLSDEQIDQLDRAYADHVTEHGLNLAREGEHKLKSFYKLVKDYQVGAGQIDNAVEFRSLLRRAVMDVFWSGNATKAMKNSEIIRNGLIHNSEYFVGTFESKLAWDDILLGFCGFCSQLQGEGFNNKYTNVLIQRQKKQKAALRHQELQQLQHFVDPSNGKAMESLQTLIEGRAGLYGELERGFMKIRAMASAIECGFDLDDQPHALHGYSPGELLKEGLDDLGEAASLQSR